MDTKRLVGGVRPHMIAGNTCAASAKPREIREAAHAHHESGLHFNIARELDASRSAPAGAKCLTAWRSCVTDRFLTARNLLIDRGLRRLPDGNRSCNLRGHGEPLQTEVH